MHPYLAFHEKTITLSSIALVLRTECRRSCQSAIGSTKKKSKTCTVPFTLGQPLWRVQGSLRDGVIDSCLRCGNDNRSRQRSAGASSSICRHCHMRYALWTCEYVGTELCKCQHLSYSYHNLILSVINLAGHC